MATKNKPCKYCGSELHLSLKCFNAPRKPIKRSVTASSAKKVKTPTKKKPKAKTRSYYVKKLDEVFSQFIRLDKSDSNGYCECVTCGNRWFWKEIQNGHFMSRRYQATRWDEDNCFPQCVGDNVFKSGSYQEYTLFMLDSYGRKFVDELRLKAQTGVKPSTPQLKEMIEDYTNKVKVLKQEKCLE